MAHTTANKYSEINEKTHAPHLTQAATLVNLNIATVAADTRAQINTILPANIRLAATDAKIDFDTMEKALTDKTRVETLFKTQAMRENYRDLFAKKLPGFLGGFPGATDTLEVTQAREKIIHVAEEVATPPAAPAPAAAATPAAAVAAVEHAELDRLRRYAKDFGDYPASWTVAPALAAGIGYTANAAITGPGVAIQLLKAGELGRTALTALEAAGAALPSGSITVFNTTISGAALSSLAAVGYGLGGLYTLGKLTNLTHKSLNWFFRGKKWSDTPSTGLSPIKNIAMGVKTVTAPLWAPVLGARWLWNKTFNTKTWSSMGSAVKTPLKSLGVAGAVGWLLSAATSVTPVGAALGGTVAGIIAYRRMRAKAGGQAEVPHAAPHADEHAEGDGAGHGADHA